MLIINLHHQSLFHIVNQVDRVIFLLIKGQVILFIMRIFNFVDAVNVRIDTLQVFLVEKMMKRSRLLTFFKSIF